jgi:hypothetical protein
MSARGNKVSIKVDFTPRLVKIRNPIAETKRPIDEIMRDPYLSDIQPLRGPKIDNAIETGRRYMPAASGLSFIVGP